MKQILFVLLPIGLLASSLALSGCTTIDKTFGDGTEHQINVNFPF